MFTSGPESGTNHMINAFNTTDAGWGQIFKWGAFLITYGGVSYELLRAYRQGVNRGDW
jgi:hypothetical protein